ncbi:MAG: hypothetical protein IK080_03960 [Clostridia bacterium]|nr:hypothetical protein [Clostridia bacterium]
MLPRVGSAQEAQGQNAIWDYSAMSYVRKALMKYEANDPTISEELANAVKALTLYSQAADAYFSKISD